MNIFKSAGFAVGFTIALLLIVVLFKFANRDHRAATAYDERQKVIRGQGYRYGFYTMIIFECVLLVLDAWEVSLPFQSGLIHFAGVLIGCLVFACHSIWNGAYWGINNDPKRYAFVFIALAALNAIPVIGALKSGTFFDEGRFAPPVLNLMVLLELLILGITLFAKHLEVQRTEEED